jgi:hypothetical protein
VLQPRFKDVHPACGARISARAFLEKAYPARKCPLREWESLC